MRKSLAILMLVLLALFTLPVAADEKPAAGGLVEWLLALVGLDGFGGYTVPGGVAGEAPADTDEYGLLTVPGGLAVASSTEDLDTDEYGLYSVPGGSTATGSDSDEFGGMTVPGGLTEQAPEKAADSDEFGGMSIPGG